MGGRKGEIAYKAGKEMGLKMARETYPDRAYLPDGSLVPRKSAWGCDQGPGPGHRKGSQNGLLRRRSSPLDGTVIDLQVDTICVHGDNPSAVEIVKKIKNDLKKEGVEIKPMGEFL